ncbi:MAG: methyltransferase domain-containing protein, partial [Bacteroidota bacterium]
GEAFSNSYIFKVAKKEKHLKTRINEIVTITKGKKVVHMGFCDHIPLIEKKINSNHWLHNELLKNCEKCIGIDIDQVAVDHIKTNYSIPDIYCHDILSRDLLPAIVNDRYDYFVLGEILEHIDNPIAFLAKIKENYGSYFDNIIISVPNALSYHNFKNTFKGIEQLNTDHRYWFTPYTLAKIITRAGYRLDEFALCQYYEGNGPLKRIMYRRFPLLRHCLMLTASTK